MTSKYNYTFEDNGLWMVLANERPILVVKDRDDAFKAAWQEAREYYLRKHEQAFAVSKELAEHVRFGAIVVDDEYEEEEVLVGYTVEIDGVSQLDVTVEHIDYISKVTERTLD